MPVCGGRLGGEDLRHDPGRAGPAEEAGPEEVSRAGPAEEAGVEDEAVNAAIDEATDPKGAVLALIMAAAPRVAQAKAAAKASGAG